MGSWGGNSMNRFRFQDLEIWKESIEIGDILFDISDSLEENKLFRFSEQLRGAGMSISNNIAEGSGSISKKEFSNFLNIARCSIFEKANIILLLNMSNLISRQVLESLLDRLDILSRKIMGFRKTIC
jgi:four helix bundle protein